MFSYYGGKGRIGKRYPAPRFPVVVEPFAGAAWYSVLHKAPKAMLFDVYGEIAAAWDWILNRATKEAIDAWPPYVPGWPMERFSDPGEDVVYRFIGNQGTEKPRNIAGSYGTSKLKWERVLHAQTNGWTFQKNSYDAAPDIEATWFIDPPYQKQNRYICNEIDYGHLAAWVKTRRGQVIVCEAQGADWLPFRPHMTNMQTSKKVTKLRHEVIWTNDEDTEWMM